MRGTSLIRLTVMIVAVAMCGCSNEIDSPGVPDSLLDAPIDISCPLHLGENKIRTIPAIKASITIEPIGKNAARSSIDNDSDLAFASSRVTALKIIIAGHTIPVSQAMIDPLADPHWVKIARNGAVTYVTIGGLDGGASYRSIFSIKNGFVQQRLIAQGEFPQVIWERTIYHDDFDLHPDRYKNM